MEQEDFFQKMIYEFNFIENLYECIHLVDPVKKEVHKIVKSPDELSETDNPCYTFWVNNKVCENCISIRAFLHNKTLAKIEYNNDKVYIVTAVPFVQKQIVIEFLQNISSDFFAYHDKNFDDIMRMIKKQNLSIVKNMLTNIYNEQFISERLPHDIVASYKTGINITLFIIKIKDMDLINIKYGFSVGDHIIEAVGTALKHLPRQEKDWLSTYSGARFVLVMYGLNENQVGRICDTIYDKVSHINYLINDQLITLQVGIGYHILKDKLISPEQFIEKAKEMLKTEGRLEGNENSLKRLTTKYSFTYREKEIALLLLKGKSNIDIAGDLYISLSTVKKHISALFTKMEVKSRTELVAKLTYEEDI